MATLPNLPFSTRTAFLLAALALAGCTERDDRHRPADGEHAYKPADHAASPALEEAIVATCFARDAFESRPVETRAGGAFEGLISLAEGRPADRSLIFDPTFRTEPTQDYDVMVPLSLEDVLQTLRSAIKVDYRRRGGSNIQGYAFRYVDKEPLVSGCDTATYVCTYDIYDCSEFDMRMRFEGSLRLFRLSSVARGKTDRAYIFRSMENVGSREAQSKRIMKSREPPSAQTGLRPQPGSGTE